jgi:methionine sulfoxide reductase catalytic subunit
MVLIRIPKIWQLSESDVTSEASFCNRRRFLQTAIATGISASVLPLMGCQQQSAEALPLEGLAKLDADHNASFEVSDRPLTGETLAATYNNFYEYGGSKSIWRSAQSLPLDDWKVEVGGLVAKPCIYEIDDLQTAFPLEERIYRFRCVEAWAMVVPWIGFPMKALLDAVEPTAAAKFVRFTSYYNPQITKGPGFPPAAYMPWPYTEGLRIEEMANELAFFAIGIYGHTLPKQHGAPLRMVTPWKYGFKGAKSIVKIDFTDSQPATFWNTLGPSEYKFEANVEPNVPHPRWSQAQERLIGPGNKFAWEERPTLLYNGYQESVAYLYSA